MTSSVPGPGPGLQLRSTPTLAGLSPAAQPKFRMAKIKGFNYQTGPAPTPDLPASVSGTFGGRGHATVGAPCPSKRVGRGHSQGTGKGRRRERAAVCPGAEQTLESLSWGSGGGAGQMESSLGRGGIPG